MREAEDGSVKFYRVLERNREQDLAELRQFETREDITTYEPVLREILALFGQAIHTSLERTMGKYLQSTGGIYRNEVAYGKSGNLNTCFNYLPIITQQSGLSPL